MSEDASDKDTDVSNEDVDVSDKDVDPDLAKNKDTYSQEEFKMMLAKGIHPQGERSVSAGQN